MSRHGIPKDAICPFCHRVMKDSNAVEAHIGAKHPRNWAEFWEKQDIRKMQRYDQDIKRRQASENGEP